MVHSKLQHTLVLRGAVLGKDKIVLFLPETINRFMENKNQSDYLK